MKKKEKEVVREIFYNDNTEKTKKKKRKLLKVTFI